MHPGESLVFPDIGHKGLRCDATRVQVEDGDVLSVTGPRLVHAAAGVYAQQSNWTTPPGAGESAGEAPKNDLNPIFMKTMRFS